MSKLQTVAKEGVQNAEVAQVQTIFQVELRGDSCSNNFGYLHPGRQF
ncbi:MULTISPECIES: hypothetical protein [unclassified Coleofasciculus]|nr:MULTISPECIES: hypothetical protein [unclassified Coleofasciculus]MBE9128274.1 hypothetical protein [Coleofasciculus sp. LEGE 07081]MBE9151321.1 hypothetical protein [Coleofasciculus sp. LEGE 07092]